MLCTSKIRPFPHHDHEIVCTRTDHTHTEHHGVVRDMAHPGSKTAITWFEHDRRAYRGRWPGLCRRNVDCILPDGHPRKCHIEKPPGVL